MMATWFGPRFMDGDVLKPEHPDEERPCCRAAAYIVMAAGLHHDAKVVARCKADGVLHVFHSFHFHPQHWHSSLMASLTPGRVHITEESRSCGVPVGLGAINRPPTVTLKAFHCSLVGQQAAFGSVQRQPSPWLQAINVAIVHSATMKFTTTFETWLCIATWILGVFVKLIGEALEGKEIISVQFFFWSIRWQQQAFKGRCEAENLNET